MRPPRASRDVRPERARRALLGFTLVELMIVLSILSMVASMAVVKYSAALGIARQAATIQELRTLMQAIEVFEAANATLPLTLADMRMQNVLDPWGNPYVFLNFAVLVPGNTGPKRKDRFIVPLNSRFDLYSMGPDGKSKPPLTAMDSWDDLIVANDGEYIGPASRY